MTRPRLLVLVPSVLLSAGCATRAARGTSPHAAAVVPVVPVYADSAQLRAGAQAVVDTFAAEVARARGAALAAAPTVEVRFTPQLILFNGDANVIVVPSWDATPAEARGVFRAVAGGRDADGEYLFRAFFNRFLVAHEAGHWFQYRADRRGPTRYADENGANRLAVAFWRTQPGGERFLAELEALAARAAAALPDPTPPGQDPAAYFGENYGALGRDPLRYGYYQFRFMRDALRDRAQLDFARMVAARRPSSGP